MNKLVALLNRYARMIKPVITKGDEGHLKIITVSFMALTIVLVTAMGIWAQSSNQLLEVEEVLNETTDTALLSETLLCQEDSYSSFMLRADPNESSREIFDVHSKAEELIIKGDWNKAKAILEKATVRFPESRHLHKQLAEVLWYLHDGKKDRSTLDRAIKEAVRAIEIGFTFGKVDYHLTSLLSMALGQTGDVETLDRIFTKAVTIEASSVVYLDYARGLSLMGNPRADEAFRKAIELETADTLVALTEYTEWLLDHEREIEVLLLPTKANPYLHFLRGVALERLNRLDEAKSEYAEYAKSAPYFSVPKRFKIQNSQIQVESGIRFIDDNHKPEGIIDKQSSNTTGAIAAISDAQAIKGLSYLIYGEARGESSGGMRAVGWIVRGRVLRGSVGSPACPYVVNTGSTLADQYKSVMCQSGQFVGMCLAWCSDPNTTKCTDNTTTYNSAKNVYYGYEPDPVSPHCPGGITSWGGSYCADSTKCYGHTRTFRLAGPVFNYGTSESCPSSYICTSNSAGKTCGNGGLDNCFYTNPIYCVGSGCVTYSGSLPGPGNCSNSASFSSSVTGYHKGHLEGPESNYNLVDFDLYLQKSSGESWQTVASSTRYASVEDINYYGSLGSYRWRVCAYTGSGSLKLYTSRPR